MASQLPDGNIAPHFSITGSGGRLRVSPATSVDKNQELLTHKAFADQLMEKVPEAIVVVDERMCILRLNPEFTRMFGYGVDEATGRILDDLIVPLEKKEEGLEITRTVVSGNTVEMETVRSRKDGVRLQVSILLTPVTVAGGNVGFYAIYRDITLRKETEKQQAALYRIAALAGSARDLQEMYRGIHEIVNELMYARNFYVALYDGAANSVSFPYFVDEKDSRPEPFQMECGLTDYVLRTGQPLLATPETLQELLQSGEVRLKGSLFSDWMGVPLKKGDETFGVLTVQSYESAHRYGQKEKEILLFVSQQVASAILNRRNLEETRESERKFRAVAEMAPSAIFIYRNTTPLYVNPASEQMTGYSREELLQRNIWDLVPVEDRAEVMARASARRKGSGAPARHEFKLVTKLGQERWVDFSATAIQYQGASAVLGIAFDISERKRNEESLQLQRALLEQLVQCAPEAILLINLDRRIVQVNREFTRIFGFSAEEALGQHTDQLLIPPEKIEETQNMIQATEAGETVSLETQRLRKDSSLVDVSILATPIEVSGKRVAYYVIYRNISDRKQAERKLRELNLSLEHRVAERTAELEEANHELEAFSYSVSHDLRAPLRHVDGFMKLLLKRAGAGFDETSSRYCHDITDASARMGALIDDLLAFSHTSRAEIQMRSVDLTELFKSVQSQLIRSLGKRRIQWRIDPLPAVQGDVALLRIAVSNLLANAVKYSRPRAEACIEVGVSLQTLSEVTIFVRDNGVGFDMQYLHKLFGVFQRLHHEDEFEGTGIGLATVRRILHRLGGKVWAESKVDEGATFYCTLKLAQAQ